MTIADTSIASLLADAAYVTGLSDGNTDAVLTGKLKGRMTLPLATFIGDNFEVVSAIDLPGFGNSGFAAVVWRGRANKPYAGQVHVSMRGTEEWSVDYFADVSLALSGLARGQVQDMVNWWLRVSTPTSASAVQVRYEEVDTGQVDMHGAPIYEYQWTQSSVQGEGLIAPAELAAGVYVNGHSLGGYLAAAFTRLLGNCAAVRHTTTFNSAGFASGSDAVFNEISAVIGSGLGRPFPGPKSSEQSNVYASKGINVVADNEFYFEQQGHRVAMFIEEGTGLPNHSMYKLTDALALAAAIEKLSVPGLTVDAVATLLEQAANTPMGSLEGMLDGLRRLLMGASVTPTPIGDAKDDAPSRVAFHVNLDELNRSGALAAIEGKLTLSTAFDPSAARTDFAALLSLTLGLPFQVRTADVAASAALGAVHGSAYELWTQDEARLQAGTDSLSLSFTEDYLRDRAAYLSALARYNAGDSSSGELASGGRSPGYRTQYVDLATGKTLLVGSPMLPVQQVRFGGDAADSLVGGLRDDRLYGGAQSDTLKGQDGNDLLDGQAGADVLEGGYGEDLLFGGAGDDTLEGGFGNDALFGGNENDTYKFAPGSGIDTIIDLDGIGSILWAGGALPAGVKLANNLWQDADKRFSYALSDGLKPGTQDLAITPTGGVDRIIVRDWSESRNLGLSLPASVHAPPTTGTFAGDFSKVVLRVEPDGTRVYQLDETLNYVSNGPEPGAADNFRGTVGDDLIEGLGGNDFLFGYDGDDVLRGGDGNDILIGGDGVDVLEGGPGIDHLYGSRTIWGSDRARAELTVAEPTMVYRGFDWQAYLNPEGTVVIQSDTGPTLYETHGNVVDAGDGDDYVEAGWADDVVAGGAGDDQLSGMEGNDVIDGGDGDDHISADGPHKGGTIDGVFYQWFYAENEGNGNDYANGGDGDDQIVGGGGEDVLFGGNGADLIYGDTDGDSNSVPVEFHGADFLDGGAGDDILVGGGRGDTLMGGAGADSLWGDSAGVLPSSPRYFAPSAHGADTLYGGDGDDYLTGEGGDDRLHGEVGNDTLRGDDDASKLDAQYHGNDVLDGGDGDDTLLGGGGDDWLIGGAGDDWLAGGDETELNAIGSLGGDDVLEGGTGEDVLIGGAGNDVLDGGAGVDYMVGGEGNDRFVAGGAEFRDIGGVMTLVVDTVVADSGSDTVQLDGVGLADLQVSLGSDGTLFLRNGNEGVAIAMGVASAVAQLELADGGISMRRAVNDLLGTVVVAIADRGDGTLLGGTLADTLSVGIDGGGTTLSAGRGDDALNIQSAHGATIQMARGDGSDTLTAVTRSVHGAKNTLVLDAGISRADVSLVWRANGWHVLSLQGGDGLTFQLTGWHDAASVPADQWPVDEIRFADGSVDTMSDVVARGVYLLPDATPGDDVVTLTPVSDTFDGLAGNDVIDGGDGNDTLYGGAGDDTLIGGNGDDTLDGGLGSNQMEGGAGNDTYRISSAGYGSGAIDAESSDDSYLIGDWLAHANYRFFVVDDAGGFDTLATSSVTSDSITVTNLGKDLMIRSGNNSHANGVWLKGAVGADGNIDDSHMLERMTFGSGQIWTATDIVARSLRTTAGNDTVLGYGANESIDGGAGDDVIGGAGGDDDLRGGAGYDRIDGGAGNDTLRAGANGGALTGGAGDDTFVVQSGEGPVYIVDLISGSASFSGNDTLRLDVSPASIVVTAQIKDQWSQVATPDTLRLSWNDGSTTVDIALSGALSTDPRSARVVYGDGTIASINALMQPYLAVASAEADSLVGTSLDDTISGLAGDDYIYGQAGDDTLLGGSGADSLVGGIGNDMFVGGPGDDVLEFRGAGDDTVVIGLGDGNDTLWAFNGTGDDAGLKSLAFGAGIEPQDVDIRWTSWHDGSSQPDQLRATVRATGESLTWQRADVEGELLIDQIVFEGGTVWDLPEILVRANAPTAGNDILIGNFGDDVISGAAGNDVLKGMLGNDILSGGAGDDYLDGGDGDDRIVGGPGDDHIRSSMGDDVASYGRGDGNDVIEALTTQYQGTKSTNLEFGADIVPSDLSGGMAIEPGSGVGTLLAVLKVAGGGSVSFGNVDRQSYLPDAVVFFDGTAWTRAQLAQRLLLGGGGHEFILGFRDADDVIVGGGGDDVLWGRAGSDTLEGGAGNDALYALGGTAGYYDGIWSSDDTDTLTGGAGDDRLYAGDGNVIYKFDLGFGHDRIEFSSDWNSTKVGTIQFGAGIASADLVFRPDLAGIRVEVSGSQDTIVIAGFEYRNPVSRIEFSDGTSLGYADIVARIDRSPTDGPDLIYGTDGADVIDALGGDDIVNAGAGDDRVHGGAGDDDIVGGSGDDWIYGDSGDDELRDGPGADHVFGGDGDDVIYVQGGGDAVDGGLGNDTIYATVDAETFLYAAGWGLDSISELTGGDTLRFDASVLTSSLQLWRLGSGLLIEQVDGASSISVWSFFGDPSASSGLSFAFADGSSWDLATIQASVSGLSGTNGADSITSLVGGGLVRALAGDDVLTGSVGSDLLDGGLGNDRMTGGAGDDVYIVDSTADIVTESSGNGNDTVRSWVSWTLGNNLENLELLGTAALNATGNGLANRLTGNAAANTLNGGSGADTMSGGGGDDFYIVDNLGDVVTELAGEGEDSVQASVSFTLAANIENLTLTGASALNGAGNSGANVITGNSGANVLDGGAGDDQLVGGAGNDTYVVDSVGDIVLELAGGGTDTVNSSISWALGAELEKLTLIGSAAVDGAGNALNNTLTGNSAANLLDGGAGNDTMAGGAGDDTYVVDSTADVVTEAAGAGTDTVLSHVTTTLASNVENLTLLGSAALNGTGNALNNVLRGNAANNTLNGGAGVDTMIGGGGDDVYVVDSAGDTVIELGDDGSDLVQSSVTYTLAAHVEKLTLTGSSAIHGTGNALDNTLTGNSANNTLTGGAGNDTLDGGSGSDTMIGGPGDDTYVVNVSTDVVTEAAGEGVDTVRSSVTLTLGANVESLTLTGTSNRNGTGNSLNNVLVGNTGVNVLTGNAGNDVLDGGAGNDTLIGGPGADDYLFGRGWGVDTIQENDSAANVTDRVLFGAGIVQADTNYVKSGNNLEVRINGSADKLVVKDWYLGSKYQVEQFRYVDGSMVTNSQVAGLIGAMAGFAPGAAAASASLVRPLPIQGGESGAWLM